MRRFNNKRRKIGGHIGAETEDKKLNHGKSLYTIPKKSGLNSNRASSRNGLRRVLLEEDTLKMEGSKVSLVKPHDFWAAFLADNPNKIHSCVQKKIEKIDINNLLPMASETLEFFKIKKEKRGKRKFQITGFFNKRKCNFDALVLVRQLYLYYICNFERKETRTFKNFDEIVSIYNDFFKDAYFIFSKWGTFSTNTDKKFINIFSKDRSGSIVAKSEDEPLRMIYRDAGTIAKVCLSDLGYEQDSVLVVDALKVKVEVPRKSKNFITTVFNRQISSHFDLMYTICEILQKLPPTWRNRILKVFSHYKFTLNIEYTRAIYSVFSLRESSRESYESYQRYFAEYLSEGPFGDLTIGKCFKLIKKGKIDHYSVIKFLEDMCTAHYNFRTVMCAKHAILYMYRVYNIKFPHYEVMKSLMGALSKIFGTPVSSSISLTSSQLEKFIRFIKKHETQESNAWLVLKCMAIFMLRKSEALNLINKNLEIKSLDVFNGPNSIGYGVNIVTAKTKLELEDAQCVLLPLRQSPFDFWCPKKLFSELKYESIAKEKPEFLFLDSNGKKWSSSKLNNLISKHWNKFKKTQKHLSEGKFTSHGFRISMFSILMSMKYNTVQIQRLARHKWIESTLYYLSKCHSLGFLPNNECPTKIIDNIGEIKVLEKSLSPMRQCMPQKNDIQNKRIPKKRALPTEFEPIPNTPRQSKGLGLKQKELILNDSLETSESDYSWEDKDSYNETLGNFKMWVENSL